MGDFEPTPFNRPGKETKSITLPTTGMVIPTSPIRRSLQDLTTAAGKDMSAGAVERTTEKFDIIGKISGISVAERRDPGMDYRDKYRCAEYAFNTVKQEPWELGENGKDREDFLVDRHDFIIKHGYEIVDDIPQAGDIITYGYWFENARWGHYEHVGVYQGDGQVISKFNEGHVYKHPWELVPEQYGTNVAFFRKIGT